MKYLTYCALIEVTRLLHLAVQTQLAMHGRGDMNTVPEVAVLFQLQGLIRYGICEKTRTIDPKEMPGLSYLLAQLPPAWERRLVDAITGEASGQCYHGRITMPPVSRVIPEPMGPLEEDYGLPTQEVR